jgi:hypothetical protein
MKVLRDKRDYHALEIEARGSFPAMPETTDGC